MTEGFRLHFIQEPDLRWDPPPDLIMSEAVTARLETFLPGWLVRGVIREIKTRIPLHFSRLFTRAKKNGKLRPVVDLSALNRLLVVPTFKMETVTVISKAISGVLWACSVDIEDAYFHVPMDWDFHKFLAFRLRGKTYVFQFLPFGLSPAPWGFSRVIKPIKRHLHVLLITIFSFLDDFILFAASPTILREVTEVVLDLLHSLGFRINWEKSNLVPSQLIEFLGVTWDLRKSLLMVPPDKKITISSRCQEICLRDFASRRELESLTGVLNFAAAYIDLGRLHLLPVLMWLNLHTHTGSRDTPVRLNEEFRGLLTSWMSQEFLARPVPMRAPRPSLTLMTDASLDGWCGILLPRKAFGTWPLSVRDLSMNWKELKAVQLALVDFRFLLEGKSVQLLSDNTTAVACLKHQGSARHGHLHSLTTDILLFCRDWRISLHPVHLRGVLNVLADQGSRCRPIATEWSLDRTTFAWVSSLAPQFQVDLFATRENAQLPHFVSPCPDHLAVGFDAFSVDWNCWTSIYLMPPMNCLGDVAQHLQEFHRRGILVAPYWPSKGWFPLLQLRCRGRPLPLPASLSLTQMTSRGLVVLNHAHF